MVVAGARLGSLNFVLRFFDFEVVVVWESDFDYVDAWARELGRARVSE